MINKEIFWAKARCFRLVTNPGLKAGVSDNEVFMDFSPKFIFLMYILISNIDRKLLVLLILAETRKNF